MTIKLQFFKHFSLVLVCIVMPSCTVQSSQAQTPQRTKKLDFKVPAANNKKAEQILDSSKWKNPTLVLYADGNVTLSWHQNKGSATFKAEDLDRHLRNIPLTGWPYGRIIMVSRCALQSGSSAQCESGYQHTVQLVYKKLRELDITAMLVPCA